MRVSPLFMLKTGIYAVQNKLLQRASNLFNRQLHKPPNLIDIKLTLQCNACCKQCHTWQAKPDRELSIDQWKKIVLDIRRYVGPCFIRFYGGEPFYKKGFLDLVQFCSDKDIAVLITTNGTLITKKVAVELKKYRIALINISLDGIQAKTHNELRGKEGIFEKAVKAIDNINGTIPVQINTTIMQQNMDEIVLLARFAFERKLQISFQGLMCFEQIVAPEEEYQRACRQNALFPQNQEKINRIFKELLAQKKVNPAIVNSYAQLNDMHQYYLQCLPEQGKSCGALRNNHLMIREDGSVWICSLFKPIGSLTRQPLQELWRSFAAVAVVKEMNRCSRTRCLAMRGYSKESLKDTFLKAKRCVFNK